MKKNTGSLYLIPTPIGDQHELDHIPFHLQLISDLRIFFVEEIKTARRTLRKMGFTADFEEVTFHTINEHSKHFDFDLWFQPILNGASAGVLSEAGMPCVADPGSLVVAAAHQRSISVLPLTGPNAMILTLAASGLNGQQFQFHGYLPRERNERIKKLKQFERMAAEYGSSQIFMDAPYRNQHVFNDARENLALHTMLCIGCDVHSQNGYVLTKSIEEWCKLNWEFSKRNVVFILGKS
jgi:16S rRNA (cytidine1402-2'-O)-methyltransferase